jgi:uncharacterized membrane protein
MTYALHLIVASVWFGGLPGVILVASTTTGSTDDRSRAAEVLNRFSALALPTMAAVIVSGLIVANRMIDTNYAGLVATTYGWLLITKLTLLAIILVIASRAKSVWVPALKQSPDIAAVGGRKLRTWVKIEFVLAVLLVIVATLLASAVPAKHDLIENWPYPFRFSIDATWGDWLVRAIVLTGLVFLIIAGAMIVLGRKKLWGTSWRITVPIVLGILGLGATLYPISVQSYPETYRTIMRTARALAVRRVQINPMRVFCKKSNQACGLQAFSGTPVACAVVVARRPNNPSKRVTASHGKVCFRRVGHVRPEAESFRSAIAKNTQPPISSMEEASCRQRNSAPAASIIFFVLRPSR